MKTGSARPKIKKYFVYKITNLVNNKIYIGKTSGGSIKHRWRQHINLTNQGEEKANKDGRRRFLLINRAMKKYGVDNFQIEQIFESDDHSTTRDKEIELIASFNSTDRNIGYNISKGGDGAFGFRFTEEQKKKMSEKRRGTKMGKNNSFYGKKHSDETKKLISESKIGQGIGSNNPFYGKKHSPESLEKMSAWQTGTTKHKMSLPEDKCQEVIDKFATGNYTPEQLREEYFVCKNLINRLLQLPLEKDTPESDISDLIKIEINIKYEPRIYTKEMLAKEYNLKKDQVSHILGITWASVVAQNIKKTLPIGNIKIPEYPKYVKPKSLTNEQVIEIHKNYNPKLNTYAEIAKKI